MGPNPHSNHAGSPIENTGHAIEHVTPSRPREKEAFKSIKLTFPENFSLPSQYDAELREEVFKRKLNERVAQSHREDAILSPTSRHVIQQFIERRNTLLTNLYAAGVGLQRDVILPQIKALQSIITVAFSEMSWRDKTDFYLKLIPFTGMLQGITGKDLRVAREGDAEKLDPLERIILSMSDLAGPLIKGAAIMAQGKLSLATIPFVIKPSKLSESIPTRVAVPEAILTTLERSIGEALPQEFRTATFIRSPKNQARFGHIENFAKSNPYYWAMWGIIASGDGLLILNPNLIAKIRDRIQRSGNSAAPPEAVPYFNFKPMEETPSVYEAAQMFLRKETPVTDVHDISLHMAPLWTIGRELHEVLSFQFQAATNVAAFANEWAPQALVPKLNIDKAELGSLGAQLEAYNKLSNRAVALYSEASLLEVEAAHTLIHDLDIHTALDVNTSLSQYLFDASTKSSHSRDIMAALLENVPEAIKSNPNPPTQKSKIYRAALKAIDQDRGEKVYSILAEQELFRMLPPLKFPSFNQARVEQELNKRLDFMSNSSAALRMLGLTQQCK